MGVCGCAKTALHARAGLLVDLASPSSVRVEQSHTTWMTPEAKSIEEDMGLRDESRDRSIMQLDPPALALEEDERSTDAGRKMLLESRRVRLVQMA